MCGHGSSPVPGECLTREATKGFHHGTRQRRKSDNTSRRAATADDYGKLTDAAGVGPTSTAPPDGCKTASRRRRHRCRRSPASGSKGAVRVAPETIVEVEFQSWTEDGQLRHPSFKQVRDDRSIDEFL
ncbi:hypothetical protein [Neomesorhizobium albiziae]|uniref:ATP dependent DNA ligase n=1 Tax=Neomesorhizobium albiziae TaxID=335020 RepID=UPI003CC80007